MHLKNVNKDYNKTKQVQPRWRLNVIQPHVYHKMVFLQVRLRPSVNTNIWNEVSSILLFYNIRDSTAILNLYVSVRLHPRWGEGFTSREGLPVIWTTPLQSQQRAVRLQLQPLSSETDSNLLSFCHNAGIIFLLRVPDFFCIVCAHWTEGFLPFVNIYSLHNGQI